MTTLTRACGRILPLLITVVLATGAFAFASDHDAVLMVWNTGSFDCEALPMELVDDWTWTCVAPVPEAALCHLQFWPGGSLDPKYGADVLHPGGLVYDDDPPQVPVEFTTPGYYHVRLLEDAPAFSVTGAAGSVRVALTFSDAPTTMPSGAGVGVVDVEGDVVLGWWPADGGGIAQVANLLPGRSYRLTASAEGYTDESIVVEVPDATPVDAALTLERLVPNEISTWSEVKALYR